MKFPFKEILGQQEVARDQQRNHEKAKEEFALPDLKWLIILGAIAVLGIAGILNWQFFTAAAPGTLGIIIGCLALLSGLTAFACWMTISNSAGRFHNAVLVVAVLLTAMDIAHASIEFWKNTNVLSQAKPEIQIYAQFFALPVLLIALTAAGYALTVFHWRHRINLSRAEAAEEIAVSEAKLRMSEVLMDNEDKLDRKRLDHLDKQIALQRQVIERVKRYADLQAEAQSALEGIADPMLRKEMEDQFKLIARIEADDKSAPSNKKSGSFVNGATHYPNP